MRLPTVDASPISISVVICTRNRPELIRHAVASVLANDYPSFDVTVVDQSVSDATHDALVELFEGDARLSYVRLHTKGKPRALNCGIKQSHGDLLAFTDDDCVVPRDWLTNVVAAFTSNRDADLLYGAVLEPPGVDYATTITPAFTITRAQRISRRDGFRIIGMGANCAATRRLFGVVGDFDEILGAGAPLGSTEDFDLLYRAYRAGLTTLLRPEVRVVHYGTRSRKDWPKVLRGYGIGDGAFFAKHLRCFDAFALWLLLHRIARPAVKVVVKGMLLGEPTDTIYLRAIFRGLRESFRFKVDRRRCVYVPR